jgi:hypothetical protein
MSSIVIAGDTSGSVTLQAPAVAGSTTLTLPATSGTVVLTGGAGAFTTLDATGVTTLQAGTAALPALTTSGDTNTGIFFPAADTIAFTEGGAESMRIDSSGNLLVGTTTATAKFNITNGSEQQISQYINNTNSSPVGVQIRYGTDINATANRFIDCIGNATSRFIVYSNGNVVNTNNSYGAISDVKLKENIVDASPKLADLMQVKVRNYNLKADPTHKQLGVIAQELETIFPAMVEQSPDTENVTEIDEDGNNIVKNISTGTYTKSVKYSVFVPMLIKAMQEQQALITALTQRITALEGN